MMSHPDIPSYYQQEVRVYDYDPMGSSEEDEDEEVQIDDLKLYRVQLGLAYVWAEDEDHAREQIADILAEEDGQYTWIDVWEVEHDND